jgi:transcriptional regulator with XRE-family HTH domain
MNRRGHQGQEQPSAFAIRVGRTLRSLRQERGWTQRALAGRLALGHTQLSKYENGTREIPLQTLMRAARLFRVAMEKFTVEEEFEYTLLLDDTLFETFRWLARRPDPEKQVALRLLVPEVLSQPQLVERFREVVMAGPKTQEAALGALAIVLASKHLSHMGSHGPRLPTFKGEPP